jgi:hypothetical protein
VFNHWRPFLKQKSMEKQKSSILEKVRQVLTNRRNKQQKPKRNKHCIKHHEYHESVTSVIPHLPILL